jgi:hypothetical protein
MWRREAGAQELEAFVCEEATDDLLQELRQKFSCCP